MDDTPTLHLPRLKRLWRRLHYQNSIRLHTLIAEGAILFVAVFFVLVGIGLFVNRTEALSWLERQEQSAIIAAQSIDNFLSTVQIGMRTTGSLDPAYLKDHPRTLDQLLWDIPALTEVVLVDASGTILAYASQAGQQVLNDPLAVASASWFLKAREGAVYTGPVQISVEDKPYLLIALPSAGGGVIAGRLDMKVLWQVVKTLETGSGGQAYIVDREGNLIAHPTSALVLENTSLSQRPEVRTALMRKGNVWAGQYVNFTSEEVIGSAQPVHNGEWVVFVEIPTHVAYANTRRALWMLQSLALLIGLSLLLSTSLAMERIIIRPLKLLRNGAWRIGSGDLAFRIHLGKQNEIGQVADAFDQMAADLHSRETALSQARDQAMAASQFKSRLLANVSHDLRTPLNGIIGFADILGEGVYGPLTDRQHTAVERILANTNRLLTLVNSLLDQSQIEAGQIRIETTDFAPVDLIRDLENVMGVLAQQKGLQLNIYLDPALPALLQGDPVHLQQVLTNLVDNAVKFCDRGTITVSMCPEDESWIIQVSDTGRGIPAEAMQNIFEPFQQVDSSVTRDQRGVGLGLSIVQQLVQLMDGAITVDSQPGQGSTFTVRLPLIPSKEMPHA